MLHPSGGSVFEEGGEGLEGSARGAHQACERAGEQALSKQESEKEQKSHENSGAKTTARKLLLTFDYSETKGEIKMVDVIKLFFSVKLEFVYLVCVINLRKQEP